MNLEDELFYVLGILSAETWKLRFCERRWGKSRKVNLLRAELAYTLIKDYDTAPTAFLVPSSIPGLPTPTFQTHCFEQDTPYPLGPLQGCGWTLGWWLPLLFECGLERNSALWRILLLQNCPFQEPKSLYRPATLRLDLGGRGHSGVFLTIWQYGCGHRGLSSWLWRCVLESGGNG